MKGFRRKRQIKEETVRIIICVAMCAALALFLVGLFLFNGNYTRIYGTPPVKSGRVDFDGVDIPLRDLSYNLTGEWEFFYNKWIVTDNEACEPDGMIDLPALWTYKDFGAGRLPKTGYGSYRLYADNVQAGINIIVYRHYADFAYRTFINGELNYGSGSVSKDVSDTVVTGDVDIKRPYTTDGGAVEIVIEVSATNTGGMNAAPWLAAVESKKAYGNGLRSFNYVVIGITVASVIISVLSFVFFGYKRDFTGPAVILAIFVHFLTSRDLLYVFGLYPKTAMLSELFSALAALALLALHFKKLGTPFKKPQSIAAAVAVAVLTALLIAFYGTPLAPCFAFSMLGVCYAYMLAFVFDRKLSVAQTCIYGVLFTFLMSVFLFELCDWLGLLVFGTEFIFTVELMIIIGCFAVLWLWKLAVTARTAIRVSELECELTSAKSQALKAQIKPHFIYNSLTAIQARYRDGLNKGDKAIEQCAAHLRLITDSAVDDLIPFEDEIRNVMNYFELENLRANGKLGLLLDIDYDEFSVPVLSIQPLVENAIRHGGLREKQDGCITLSSVKNDDCITVTVSDNGVGFDPETVHAGVGIENTRKRFELIHAEMQIDSARGGGTRVTIIIPTEKI